MEEYKIKSSKVKTMYSSFHKGWKILEKFLALRPVRTVDDVGGRWISKAAWRQFSSYRSPTVVWQRLFKFTIGSYTQFAAHQVLNLRSTQKTDLVKRCDEWLKFSSKLVGCLSSSSLGNFTFLSYCANVLWTYQWQCDSLIILNKYFGCTSANFFFFKK
jgi:hypothetical protein